MSKDDSKLAYKPNKVVFYLKPIDKDPTGTKKKRFIQLSWQILEHKCRYYVFDDPIIEDHEYDKLEREYEVLAKELNKEPTATNMVGFDKTRPSCQRVLTKIHSERTMK